MTTVHYILIFWALPALLVLSYESIRLIRRLGKPYLEKPKWGYKWEIGLIIAGAVFYPLYLYIGLSLWRQERMREKKRSTSSH